MTTHRELTETELLALATKLAETPERWRHLVEHDPEQRTYTRLLHNDAFEAYVIAWMDGHDTGFHDHDVSRGALLVVDGEIREDRLTIGGPPNSKYLGAGQSVTFSAADIHRVLHSGDRPAVTIHVYSPPIRQMGSYEFEEDGTLKRHPRANDEELKPVDNEVARAA